MTSRRRFLTQILGAGAAAISGSCSTVQTETGRTRRLIVDTQVHVWQPNTPERPWPANAGPPQLPEPFSYERLLALMDEAHVDRVILVPPSWQGIRNDYALEAVAKHPDRFAVMGLVPITDPKAAERLPSWKQQPGMLGIRTFFNRAASVRLRDGTADWLWPAAEKAGIPIMFLAFDMAALTNIAERHPGLVVIIDHMGLSTEAVRDGLRDALIDTTVSMARFPNVSVKLSGIGAYSLEPYPWRDMTPYLHRVFDAYGPRRCYWGSDMTNSFAKASYVQRVAHMEELPFLSEHDKDWIMGRAILNRLSWTA
jgi:predicted TIM-barrel fold metal-dependent hydrolase